MAQRCLFPVPSCLSNAGRMTCEMRGVCGDTETREEADCLIENSWRLVAPNRRPGFHSQRTPTAGVDFALCRASSSLLQVPLAITLASCCARELVSSYLHRPSPPVQIVELPWWLVPGLPLRSRLSPTTTIPRLEASRRHVVHSRKRCSGPAFCQVSSREGSRSAPDT